jgi:hypothetical protein
MTWLTVTMYPCHNFTNYHRYVPCVAITIQSFPHLSLTTEFVARVRWMPAVEHELLTPPEHMSPPPPGFLCGVRVARSLVFCRTLCRSWLVLLVIALSVFRFTDSDCPLSIFKLFLQEA